MSRPHAGRILRVALLLLSPLTPARARAQAAPLVLEISGGASIPVGSLRDGVGVGEGTSAGRSFSVDFALSGAGRRTTYVGFSQHRFGCSRAGCASGDRYVATGLDVGFRLSLLRSGAVNPWIRLGALTTRVEMPSTSPTPGVSALGVGGDVGFGVFLGTSRTIALNPEIRLAAVNSGLPGGGVLRMRFLVADLAVVVAF